MCTMLNAHYMISKKALTPLACQQMFHILNKK